MCTPKDDDASHKSLRRYHKRRDNPPPPQRSAFQRRMIINHMFILTKLSCKLALSKELSLFHITKLAHKTC